MMKCVQRFVTMNKEYIEVTKKMKLAAFKALYKNLTPEQRRAVPMIKAHIEKLERALGLKKKPTLIETLQTILNIKQKQ